MSCESFDAFSARYSSHTDFLIRSRNQKLFVGENATLYNEEECPVRVLMRFSLDTFCSEIVLSADEETKYSLLVKMLHYLRYESLTGECIEQNTILEIYS